MCLLKSFPKLFKCCRALVQVSNGVCINPLIVGGWMWVNANIYIYIYIYIYVIAPITRLTIRVFCCPNPQHTIFYFDYTPTGELGDFIRMLMDSIHQGTFVQDQAMPHSAFPLPQIHVRAALDVRHRYPDQHEQHGGHEQVEAYGFNVDLNVSLKQLEKSGHALASYASALILHDVPMRPYFYKALTGEAVQVARSANGPCTFSARDAIQFIWAMSTKGWYFRAEELNPFCAIIFAELEASYKTAHDYLGVWMCTNLGFVLSLHYCLLSDSPLYSIIGNFLSVYKRTR